MENINSPDISAYPIIRIDQIVLLDNELLKKALEDAFILLTSLKKDEPTSQIIYYLQKQLDAMKVEQTKRAANARVSNLLDGIQDTLNLNFSGPSKLLTETSPRKSKTHDDSTTRQSNSAPADIIKKFNSESISSYKPIRDRSTKVNANDEKDTITNETSAAIPISNSKTFDEISSETLNLESRGPDAYQSIINRDLLIHENQNKIKVEKRKKIMNENFGNTFVVESTHKKIRFFSKKIPVESHEIILSRERDKRFILYNLIFLVLIIYLS
jgi:hypothetical protein